MKIGNDRLTIKALVLAAAVLGHTVWVPGGGLLTGRAEEIVSTPDTQTPLDSYTAMEMRCFEDQILEYWEIQGLVEHYNPAYLDQLAIFYGNPDGTSGLSRDQLLVMADLFRYEAKELENEAKELKDSISSEAYKEYQDNIKTLKRYAREKEEEAEGNASTRRALRIVRNQEVIAVSAQMREYQKLVSEDQIAQKQLELAELSYASSERQYSLGMISAGELLSAQDALNATRAARDTTEAALRKSRQTLITDLGWGYDGNPEIRPIPDPDLTVIDGYDLAADTELAVGANYDVADLRRTDKSEFNGLQDKNRQIKEKETQVRMEMEFLYNDVQQKRVSFQAAQDAWPAAEAAFAQAGRKLELGMISRSEYLAEEIAWLISKAQRDQAALDLRAAMETYEWAVKGLIGR